MVVLALEKVFERISVRCRSICQRPHLICLHASPLFIGKLSLHAFTCFAYLLRCELLLCFVQYFSLRGVHVLWFYVDAAVQSPKFLVSPSRRLAEISRRE